MKTASISLVCLLACAACASSQEDCCGDGDTDPGSDVLPDDPCLANDTDDCDGDWISNGLESTLGLDPLSGDSDGDGTLDIAEIALCCDGGSPYSAGCAAAVADPECGLDPDEYYVELRRGHGENRDLDFGTQVQQADVYFLVDTTLSMDGEIANLRDGLSTLSEVLDDAIPDVWFGVGRFDDFPVDPYGNGGDTVYEHLVSISGETASVQAALDGLEVHRGGDIPESQAESLYQIATGEGLTTYVPPHSGCLDDGIGRPCFRPESLPVILMCTDAPFHNGPPTGGSEAYDNGVLGLGHSHTWREAMEEVNGIGAKVLTVFSGQDMYRDEHVQSAEATGAVTAEGEPLVFDIAEDGSGMGSTIASAVVALAGQVPRDVSAAWSEDPVVDDGVEAAGFIKSITPVSCAPSGHCAVTDTSFEDTLPGTLLTFDIRFENDFVDADETGPRIFLLRILVLGDSTVRLDSRRVVVLVPPTVILI